VRVWFQDGATWFKPWSELQTQEKAFVVRAERKPFEENERTGTGMSEHMADATEKLFVYGTLLPGHGNYPLIESHVQNAQAATIEGILVDLGDFPALVAGNGIVNGIVLEVGQVALHIADRIEGYAPGREGCLYLREEVQVRLDDGTQIAGWAYRYACPGDIADRTRLVVSRDGENPVHEWPSNQIMHHSA